MSQQLSGEAKNIIKKETRNKAFCKRAEKALDSSFNNTTVKVTALPLSNGLKGF